MSSSADVATGAVLLGSLFFVGLFVVSTRESTASRRTPGRVILVLSSLLASLFLGESVSRLLGLSKTWNSYVASEEMATTWRHTEERVGYREIPGRTWTTPRGQLFSANSEGFRDSEFSWPRPAGVTRLAFLGDSVTEGFGIPVQARYSNLLAKILAARSAKAIQALNLGIAGHSTVDEYVVLRDFALRHEPDVVFLQLGWNDIATNLERLPFLDEARPDPHPKSQTIGSASELSPKRFLQRHSSLYLAVAERYNLYLLRQYGSSELLSAVLAASDPGWMSTVEILHRLFDICRAHRIPLLVSYFPQEVEVQTADDQKASIIDSKIRRLCDNGITFVDLLKTFRRHRGEDLYLDDVHLTERGNAIVAEELVGPFLEVLADTRDQQRADRSPR